MLDHCLPPGARIPPLHAAHSSWVHGQDPACFCEAARMHTFNNDPFTGQCCFRNIYPIECTHMRIDAH